MHCNTLWHSIQALVVFSYSLTSLNAQPQIEAQLRPRFEIRDGYQKLAPKGSVPAAFISQRTRLGIIWESEQFILRITPQDIRIWGDEQVNSATGVFGDNASVELFEANVLLKLSNSARLKIGRQQLEYDNEWLLSSRNWNQQGLAYDAVIAMLKPGNWNIHLGASWNSFSSARHNNYYPPDRIKSLNYLWLEKPQTGDFKLSLLHISAGYTENVASNKMNFTHTTGFRPIYNGLYFELASNLYYQYGNNQRGQKISAYLLAAEASWKTGALSPGAGFSYLSGNSNTDPASTEDNLFNMYYGARHMHLGFMDYFGNTGPDTGQGGVVDHYLYFNYTPSGSINFKNTLHLFRLAETSQNTSGSKHLGWENDLVMRYRLREGWSAELGYCFFVPGESMQIIQNIPDNRFSQFIYLQLTVFQGILGNRKD